MAQLVAAVVAVRFHFMALAMQRQCHDAFAGEIDFAALKHALAGPRAGAAKSGARKAGATRKAGIGEDSRKIDRHRHEHKARQRGSSACLGNQEVTPFGNRQGTHNQ